MGLSVEINGAALRHVRMLTGISASALAREMGVTPTYISLLETGARKRCSAEVFSKLNTQLRISDQRTLMACPALVEPVAA